MQFNVYIKPIQEIKEKLKNKNRGNNQKSIDPIIICIQYCLNNKKRFTDKTRTDVKIILII